MQDKTASKLQNDEETNIFMIYAYSHYRPFMDTQSRSGFKVYCLIWFDFYFSREKLGRQSLVACAFLAKSITTWRGALGGNTWDWRNSFKSWRIFVHFDSFYGLLFQYGAAV